MISSSASVYAKSANPSAWARTAKSDPYWWRLLAGLFRAPSRPPILDEAAFLAGLRKEQRRIERSSRAFLLVRITAPELFGSTGNSRHRKKALRVFAAAARQTDTIGWIESGKVLGLICTELGTGPEASARAAILTRLEHAASVHLSTIEVGLKVELYCPRATSNHFAVRPAQVSR